jgi:hypothetical protein
VSAAFSLPRSWAEHFPALRAVVPEDAQIRSFEGRFRIPQAQEVQTVVYIPRERADLDGLDALWKSLRANQRAGGAGYRSATGEGWHCDVRALADGLYAMAVFPCGATELGRALRTELTQLRPYRAILARLDDASIEMGYHRREVDEPSRAGLLLDKRIASSIVEEALGADGYARGADGLWRCADDSSAVNVWLYMDSQVHVSLNL